MKLLLTFVFALAACSPSSPPPPTAPASKANCPLCGFMGDDRYTAADDTTDTTTDDTTDATTDDTTDATTDDTTDTTADDNFDIELVFLDSFDYSKRLWIIDVARQWEHFFFDMPDHVFDTPTTISVGDRTIRLKEGEVIDDIRIYVDKPTTEEMKRSSSVWTDDRPEGFASVPLFRPDGDVPLIARITIDDEQINSNLDSFFAPPDAPEIHWRRIFQHEMGHAMGIGSSPVWDRYVVWERVPDGLRPGKTIWTAWFTGPNAMREYRNMLEAPALGEDGLPINDQTLTADLMKVSFSNDHATVVIDYAELADKGIPLSINTLVSPRRAYHWGLVMQWAFFSAYYIRENDLPNVTNISLGTFHDIGWNVNYTAGAETIPMGSSILPCRLLGDYGNFRLCTRPSSGKVVVNDTPTAHSHWWGVH